VQNRCANYQISPAVAISFVAKSNRKSSLGSDLIQAPMFTGGGIGAIIGSGLPALKTRAIGSALSAGTHEDIGACLAALLDTGIHGRSFGDHARAPVSGP
jgi:hypothetical protein